MLNFIRVKYFRTFFGDENIFTMKKKRITVLFLPSFVNKVIINAAGLFPIMRSLL